MSIKIHFEGVFNDPGAETVPESLTKKAFNQLVNKTGKGNEFLGWLDIPDQMTQEKIEEIQNCADRLSAQSEIVVMIGIGGSYLGARAVIEALQNPFYNLMEKGETPKIIYAGHHISEDYLHHLLQLLNHKSYSLIVISKSGTTTEPALAFRILKEHCEKKYGLEESQKRIVAITDASRGALKQLANKNNYQTFVIPDDVGGRYSVLTAVGLLPIAIAGFNIEQLIAGAAKMKEELFQNDDPNSNVAMQYALYRNLLYNKNGKKIELVVAYEPELFYFIEWFKQLYGESDGKEGKGLFPAGAIFSTDLHSLGQYIQEGERHLFETVISVEKSQFKVTIPYDEENLDGLNYLQYRSIHEINQIAEEGTRQAHISGGVPNIRIQIPEINEQHLGEMIFFFEMSCALGGYLMDINPFNQPGVEAYKQQMFKLLGKPK
jgi:glucose-6-phosphate isomerase